MEVIADRYEIVQRLGTSDGVETLRAHDRKDGRDVVVKRFTPALASGEGEGTFRAAALAELFRTEAQLLAQIREPGVPRLVDWLEDGTPEDPVLILVQEWVGGRSLQQRLDAGERLDERTARRVLLDVAEVLDGLHDRKPPIVHGNIRPANVILGPDGRAVLTDFGAVRQRLARSAGGASGALTTPYSPPEAAFEHRRASHDVYALGLTVVHALTGEDPSELARSSEGVVVPPRAGSAGLVRLLTHMLRTDPARRPASVGEVEKAVRGLPPLREANAAPSRSRPWALLAGAAALLFFAGTGVYLSLPAPDRASTFDGPSGVRRLETDALHYPAGARVRVFYDLERGNPSDWITVVPADASDSTYHQWAWLEADGQGVFEASGLAPGHYEARLYLDWPAGSYTVRGRASFVVDPPAPLTLLPSVDRALDGATVRERSTLDDAPGQIAWATSSHGFSSQYADPAWSAAQAVGRPDVFPRHGDLQEAWASKAPDAGTEWLILGFDTTEPATAVRIVETLHPGALVRVDDVSGPTSVALWAGTTESLTDRSRVLEVVLPEARAITRLRLVLDTRRVAGWNEIDAVGLVGAAR